MFITRYRQNPILSPNVENEWESFATFNGNVFWWNGNYHMVYRAISSFRSMEKQDVRMSSLGHAVSKDGLHFSRRGLWIRPELPWDRFGCEDPRVTCLDDKVYLFYTGIGAYPFVPDHIRVGVAVYDSLDKPPARHLVTPFNAKAMALFPEKINGKYTVILTANTDQPPATVAIAQFEREKDLWSREGWKAWYQDLPQHSLPLQRLNTDQIEVGAPPLKTKDGWLLIYCRIQNYDHPGTVFGIEAALLDLENPHKIVARSVEPILVPSAGYEVHGTVPNVIFPSGALMVGEALHIYYGGADTVCAVATCHLDTLLRSLHREHHPFPAMIRSRKNPVLSARWNHPWERLGVYNPGTFQEGDVTHVIYRAQDNMGTSCFGLASFGTENGELLSREDEPIYVPRAEFEDKAHHNGFSGCEDPRITLLDQRLFMLYTAYRGDSPPRVALTSIAPEEFGRHEWHKWTSPILISPPGIADKDACLFPEKILGEYVTVHRIEPNIVFDFRKNLDFDGESRWLLVQGEIHPRLNSWEGVKIGANTPPLKTQEGWLLFYHGVGSHDHHYRLGALLLDFDNPAQVLGRSRDPILQPECYPEKYGQVRNVVFPCGLSCHGDKLKIYYGAADTSTCLACVSLADLLSYLKDCGPLM